MSKSFHGPFRITRADVKFGNDGDCYLTLHEGAQRTIGVILQCDHVLEIADCLESAASRIRERVNSPKMGQICVEHETK
jgi:hypothetical protein